jgi:hypothetical protein
MNFKAIKLDSRSVDYMKAEVSFTNEIGRALSSIVQWESGTCVAIVPAIHRENLYNFESSIFDYSGQPRIPVPGGEMQAVQSTSGFVSRWVSRILREDLARVFVCESFLLRSSDFRSSDQVPRGTFLCGKFVYHIATHVESDESISDAVHMVYPVPLGLGLVGVLSGNHPNWLEGERVDLDILLNIARNVEAILLGVYDGESVLIWTRDESPIVV